ncbi:Hypothetical predicted protein, partial [Podarcis lilfordi]
PASPHPIFRILCISITAATAPVLPVGCKVHQWSQRNYGTADAQNPGEDPAADGK